MKVAIHSLENVEKFKYLGMRLTGQSYIYEEMKRRLKLDNACCHSVHNHLFHSGEKMTI